MSLELLSNLEDAPLCSDQGRGSLDMVGTGQIVMVVALEFTNTQAKTKQHRLS